MKSTSVLASSTQLIDRESFLDQAEQHISENIKNRISPQVLSRLQSENLFFDVHAHCFTFEDVPPSFPKSRFIKIPKRSFIVKLHRFIRKYLPFNILNLAKRLGIVDTLIKYDSRAIIEELINAYHMFFSGIGADKDLMIVLLPMDMTVGITAPKAQNAFFNQIDILRDNVKYYNDEEQDALKATLLPFIAIDPNNERAFNYFLECFSSLEWMRSLHLPAVGVKIYPCLGYLPSHPVLMDIFNICHKKKIPITTHCGGKSVQTDYKRIYIQGYELKSDGTFSLKINNAGQEGTKIKDTEKYFNRPNNWLPVLNEYKSLKLNLAHLGSFVEWNSYLKNPHNPDNHVWQTLDIIKKYDNVYADISYAFSEMKYLKVIHSLMKENEVFQEKFLFGTDYYMVNQEGELYEHLSDLFSVFKEDTALLKRLFVDNPKRFLFDF